MSLKRYLEGITRTTQKRMSVKTGIWTQSHYNPKNEIRNLPQTLEWYMMLKVSSRLVALNVPTDTTGKN